MKSNLDLNDLKKKLSNLNFPKTIKSSSTKRPVKKELK